MNLIDKIEIYARSNPDRIAVYHPRFTISWSQLSNLVSIHARNLVARGIQTSQVVGISQSKQLINLINSLALLKLGIPFVDLNEKNMNLEKVQSQLGVSHVITNSNNRLSEAESMKITNLLDVHVELSCVDIQSTAMEDIAFFVQTSGTTTGSPKYISMTNRILLKRFQGYTTNFSFAETDIFWTPIAVSFSSSKLRYFSALMNGASISIGIALDKVGIDFLNFIGASKFFCTPSQLFKLIDIGIPLKWASYIAASTSFISEKLRKEFREQINRNLYIAYGTTETGIVTEADPLLQLKSPNTVGKPFKNSFVQIVDEKDNITAQGLSGIVRIKSPGMCNSYFQNRSASDAAFRDGWFYPGDLGYFDNENSLILLGRSDDMMIFDGVNLHPSEIENVLSSHPAVIDVVAFSFPHEKYGDIPVAAVKLRTSIEEIQLIKFCAKKIGNRAPKKIVFAESFPRNEVGKVLRRSLFEHFKEQLMGRA